ncbi:MAG: transcriptional repressor LexA [Rhodospirillales bacterium]
MLTKKQHELLMYIEKRLRENGVSPSFDEMKEALNLKSKSGIHRLITGLEERGFIRRLPHRARALEIVKLPGAAAEPDPPAVPKPVVVRGDFRTKRPWRVSRDDMVALPMWGRIAAGTPIEALQDHSQTVDVPPSMLGGGEHYALEIEGDSMVDAGIHNGDTVIIRKGDNADSGEIVVALVDGSEATLKRLRRKQGSVALEPANVKHETRTFGPDRVKVQGRLVGLIRTY